MSRRLLVLGWHNIDPTPYNPADPGAGRRGFARQLAALDRVATVVPLDVAVTTLATGGSLPPRAVALTFDDGYADGLTAAVPLLDRRGMHGTFFLVSDLVSGRSGAWWEDLADALDRATAPHLTWRGRELDLSTPLARTRAMEVFKGDLKGLDAAARVATVTDVAGRIAPPPPPREPLFLDWEGAGVLAATGHGVGSHTVSHPILARESADGQRHELVESRRALEAGLGQTVDLLAYPNGTAGDYDAVTTSLAEEAGYRAAVTTRPGLAGPGEPFEMHRVLLTPLTDVRELVGKVVRKSAGVATRAARTVRSRVAR